MSAEVFAFFADHLSQPFLELRIVDVIVVDPTFVARVVGRIDVDAFHLAFILRQQRLEGCEVVTVYDHVARSRRGGFGSGKCVLLIEYAEGYVVVMIDDFLFPNLV